MEIHRRSNLDYEAKMPWKRGKNQHKVFHGNVVLSTPKGKQKQEYSNIFNDYDEVVKNALDERHWQRSKNKYVDWYPYDTRIGELQRLLELKFQNSQTELKRKFYDNIRAVKSEIDTKQHNLAKHLREVKNMAQKEREEKERLQMEVNRLLRKEHDLKEREELMNSLLRNDMKFKTPPLPKIYNQIKDIKPRIDTSGYHTRPINIVASTNNYYSRHNAIPHFDSSEFTMNDPNNLDGEVDVGEETDRVRKLQNDRLDMIENIEKSLDQNSKQDLTFSIEKLRKTTKPFKLSKEIKRQAYSNAKIGKKSLNHYRPKERANKRLDDMIDDSFSRNYKITNMHSLEPPSIRNDLDDSLIKFPSHGLLNFNDV